MVDHETTDTDAFDYIGLTLTRRDGCRGTARACLGGRTFREADFPGGNVAVRLPGGRQAHAVLAHGKKEEKEREPV